jgi:hypothetical protein
LRGPGASACLVPCRALLSAVGERRDTPRDGRGVAQMPSARSALLHANCDGAARRSRAPPSVRACGRRRGAVLALPHGSDAIDQGFSSTHTFEGRDSSGHVQVLGSQLCKLGAYGGLSHLSIVGGGSVGLRGARFFSPFLAGMANGCTPRPRAFWVGGEFVKTTKKPAPSPRIVKRDAGGKFTPHGSRRAK